MAKKCAMCGIEMGIFTGKVQLKDKEFVCTKCWERTGFNSWNDLVDKAQIYTSRDIVKMVRDKEASVNMIKEFVATTDVGVLAKFNDNIRQMILADKEFIYSAFDKNPQRKYFKNYTMFSYNQIIGFELLEDGKSVASGGVGRAVVGGLLFGGVGAIVGAATRSHQEVCKEMKVKIVVKDYFAPAFYISLITTETKKNSSDYKQKMKIAQDIMAKLHLVVNSNQEVVLTEKTTTHTKSGDKFAEIRMYKELYEDGIISLEEFESKKKELLGL